MSRRARLGFAALVALGIATLATAIALAQGEAADKVRTGDLIEVPAGQTLAHNVYAFGRSIRIDGTVEGDLIAAGVDVTVNGTVTGDILGAANNLTVHGTVLGDVRVVGEVVIVSGGVGGDLAVAGGRVLVTGSGSIGEEFLFLGSDVTVDGTVTGDVLGSATTYARNGTVGGTESVTLPDEGDQAASDAAAAKAVDAIRQFVVVLLFGALGLWLAPKLLRASAAAIRARPLVAFGGGFLSLVGYIVVVIAIVIAMFVVAIAFAPLGFEAVIVFDLVGGLLAASGLVVGLIFFATFLGDAIVGLALGRLASNTERSRSTELLWLAVGSAIVVLVTSFPVVGAWFKLAVILLAMGGVLLAVRERRRGPVLPPPLSPPAAAGDGWR